MKTFPVMAMIVLLFAAAPAFGQWTQQKDIVALGKITSVDLQNGTLTLDTGQQFTLAPTVQYATTPTINQEVQVTYREQDGKRIASSIDLQSTDINRRR